MFNNVNSFFCFPEKKNKNPEFFVESVETNNSLESEKILEKSSTSFTGKLKTDGFLCG